MELAKEMKPFFDDEEKLAIWPSKPAKKMLVLQHLQSKFEKGKKYTELEVNIILKANNSFNDHALLRRELYNKKLLDRTLNGSAYWIP